MGSPFLCIKVRLSKLGYFYLDLCKSMHFGKIISLRKYIVALLFLLALIATFVIYHPGLQGPFLFDDGLNVVQNQSLRLETLSRESLRSAAFSVPNGVFGRPISMLSFAFNFYLDRGKVEPFLTAYPFKLTNLVIHLVNGVVVFILTRMLVGLYRRIREPDLPATYPDWLALAVSTAWLLHPLNVTTVLYVVQRMAMLAAFFSSAGLAVYLWGRAQLFEGKRGGGVAILSSLLLFGPLALLSKENGALLPLFMLAAELTLFRFETARSSSRRFLIAFFTALVILPALALLAYITLHPDLLLAGYAKRDFTLGQRLMTEARVVWIYLRLILLPSNALMGIFHDDIALSGTLFDPVTTLPALLGLLVLAFSAWWLRQRQPLIAFGILFFLIGQSMESTVYPLELVFEHRNYLPMFGILLAFFHLLLNPLPSLSTLRVRQVMVCLLIPLFAVDTLSRANDWSSASTLWTSEADHHPESVRANTTLADSYANALTLDPATRANNYLIARAFYEKALSLHHDETPALLGMVQLSVSYDKPISSEWLAKLNNDLAHDAIPANTNDHLLNLAICLKQAHCPLTTGDIDLLMHAPLQNPMVTGRDRALIFNALTIYQFNILGNYPAALDSARRAAALDTDINHQFWLATILTAMHRTKEARQQIDMLKKLDTHGLLGEDIAKLEQQLPH